MPSRVALRVLVLALALLALPLSHAIATHSPTVEDLIIVATSDGMNMQCDAPGGAQVTCSLYDFDQTFSEFAIAKPGTGPLVSLYTYVDALPVWLSDPSLFSAWMSTLQSEACGPTRVSAAQVLGFVNGVLALRSQGTVAPVTIPGECGLTGGLNVTRDVTGAVTLVEYWVNSVVIAPQPTPPPPTPAPTPKPTSRAAPTPVPTPVPTPTPSPTPTASPTPSPSPTATPRPTGTPEQSVAGITFAPQASPLAGAPGEETGSGSGGDGGWADAVPLASQASTDPSTVGVSALVALLLLILLGFAAELFNNTLESHYDVITGWWHKTWPGGK